MTVPSDGREDAEAGVNEVFASLDEKPTLSRYVGAARRLDRIAEGHPDHFATRRIAVVRNFTIEPIEPLLKVGSYRQGLRTRLTYSGYDPADDDDLADLLAGDPDVVLLALRLEDLAPALTTDFAELPIEQRTQLSLATVERVVALARGVRSRCRAAILVLNFVSPVSLPEGLADYQHVDGQLNTLRRMNMQLADEVHAIEGAYIVDADHLFAAIGLENSHDDRGDRTSGAPLSQQALRVLADALVRYIRALAGPAAKCVIVDCDNTLWGGVVGEDGIEGLALGDTGEGRLHRELQQTLRNLRRRGVVLAVCSKNEEADVLAVFRSHPDCLLHEEDFAAVRINWEDKADNVASIAKELNLGLEHVVFVDDNPVECDWIRARLPAVKVIQWPDDVGDGRTLDDLGLFDTLSVTDEDSSRTEMYRAEGGRRAAQQSAVSPEDYLRSLSMSATIGSAARQHLPRLAQLCQRTNQFNLTTRRHDVAGLEAILADPNARVVWLDLRDRFGPHGMVGCGIVRLHEDSALIDTLLLSCRVLGRGAEALIVRKLASSAREMGASAIVGEYLATERNRQVADLYTRLGFEGPDPELPVPTWRWSMSKGLPSCPDWFEIVELNGANDE